MTLVPLQLPSHIASMPERSHTHEDSSWNGGERGNQACCEFWGAVPDGVEDEPRVSVVQFLDIPEAGNVNVRNCKRFGKNCAIAIQHDNPRYSCSARGIQSRKREPANNTIQSFRPMVKEVSTRGFLA